MATAWIGEPDHERALGADAVGDEPADDLAAQRGQPRRAEHRGGGHRRHAVVDGVGDHVEDRPRVRRAAREVRERDGRELRRADRLAHRELAAAGRRPLRRPAAPAGAGGSRTRRAAGMTTSHASSPMTNMAVRQS